MKEAASISADSSSLSCCTKSPPVHKDVYHSSLLPEKLRWQKKYYASFHTASSYRISQSSVYKYYLPCSTWVTSSPGLPAFFGGYVKASRSLGTRLVLGYQVWMQLIAGLLRYNALWISRCKLLARHLRMLISTRSRVRVQSPSSSRASILALMPLHMSLLSTP